MNAVTFDRWQSICKACGIAARLQDYRRVVRGWSSRGRRYHTPKHLEACLREFDGVRSLALYPGEVEMALWFHDAVYSTWRSDNEARSAELAGEIMRSGGAQSPSIQRVKATILATRHQEDAPNEDAALVVDIDLSILGQAEDVYQEFERNIRREYWWVPRRRYVAGRCLILKSFLQRSTIYHFDEFRTRYEAIARLNLTAAITRLEG
jgi:predicted metal-dependent HD superfamily phosphohydrolase